METIKDAPIGRTFERLLQVSEKETKALLMGEEILLESAVDILEEIMEEIGI